MVTHVKAQPECPHCKKTNYDDPDNCKKATVYSPCVGDWLCNYKPSSTTSTKPNDKQ